MISLPPVPSGPATPRPLLVPAGGSVVGVILAVILILVLLDLLGATDVFPVIDPIG